MFPKKNRISTGFKAILRSGTKIKTTYCLLIVKENYCPYSRFGIITTKKIGNAVIRNKVRRFIRSILREYITSIPSGFDIVIIPSQFIPDWKRIDKNEFKTVLLDALKSI